MSCVFHGGCDSEKDDVERRGRNVNPRRDKDSDEKNRMRRKKTGESHKERLVLLQVIHFPFRWLKRWELKASTGNARIAGILIYSPFFEGRAAYSCSLTKQPAAPQTNIGI